MPTARKKPEFTSEQLLDRDLRARGIPFTPQYKFHPDRMWTFDFAWPGQMLAVEVQGLGRHNRPQGMNEDYNKFNCATELGWKVLCIPAGTCRTNKRRARFIDQIFRILCGVADPDESTIVLHGDFEN